MLARKTRSRLAKIVFALIIIVLMLAGILAVLSPVLREWLGVKEYRVEVYAASEYAGLAEHVAKLLGESIDASYEVKWLKMSSNHTLVGVIVYKNKEPLLVTFVNASASDNSIKMIGSTLRMILSQVQAALRPNETILYLDGNQFYMLPRNTTAIVNFIEAMLMGQSS
jgi:hypothetical protein